MGDDPKISHIHFSCKKLNLYNKISLSHPPYNRVPVCDDCDHHLHHAAQCEKVPLHELCPREEDDNLCSEHCHCDGTLH